MAHTLDAFRFLIGAGLLLYASLKDLQVRRVSNDVWIFGAIFGVLLLGTDLWITQAATWVHVFVAAAVVLLAYGLWYVHVLAGGADAKALMMLAVLVPVPLAWEFGGRLLPLWPSPLPVPPALVIFANAVLFLVLVPLAFGAFNLARGDLRFPQMFLGYRMDLAAAERAHVWIVERVRDDGTLRHALWVSAASEHENDENLERLKEKGLGRVWTTPKVPFMVPLFLGFLAAFFLGDLLTQWVVGPLVR